MGLGIWDFADCGIRNIYDPVDRVQPRKTDLLRI